jgi:trk system potassium uptake protein TrkH
VAESRGALSLGDVTYLVASVLLGVGVALAACTLAAIAMRDTSGWALGITTMVSLAAGVVGRSLTHVPKDISFREAFAMVSLSWVAVAIVGALPYLLSGVLTSPAAALFESMSGFTTTGSSVLADIEAAPPGILLWRSLTQWLGGMGIIVLGIAVLPYLGVGGMQLFRLEAPGPTTDRLRPRIRETAKLLWKVYAALTAILTVLFLFGGMSLFDAVNHAFTTMPTGGFSTRNASMAAFGPYVQWLTILFMFLAGTSFTLHYRLLSRGPVAYWRSTEWRLYSAVILMGTVVVALLLSDQGLAFEPRVRDAAFQVVSIVTTTGYATSDYVLWHPGAQVALFLLFFLGGMAGSTAGGMKMVRVLLVLKQTWIEVRRQLHPRAVLLPKVAGKVVPEHVMLNVRGFTLLYLLLFGVGTLAMASFGLSLPAAAGAAATSVSNVGPALAELGPVANFSGLPWPAQLILTVLMLIGRLEIYTVLLLFHPGLWRR